MLTSKERSERGIQSPPFNGVETRLEAILAELIGIRQALQPPAPVAAPEAPPAEPHPVTLREPTGSGRTRKRGSP